MSKETMMRDVRISFPRLFEPNPTINGNLTKPGATFILDPEKNADLIADLRQQINEIINTKNGGTALPSDRLCVRRGEGRAEYLGKVIVTAKTGAYDRLPHVYDENRRLVTSSRELMSYYSGIRCNAVIKLWWQNHPSFGKRVNAELIAVQIMTGGEQIATVKEEISAEVAATYFDDMGNAHQPSNAAPAAPPAPAQSTAAQYAAPAQSTAAQYAAPAQSTAAQYAQASGGDFEDDIPF